jgi:hypothetical protein
MICGRQARVQSLLTGVIPSRRTVQACVALDHLSEGCEAPEKGYSLGVLTV